MRFFYITIFILLSWISYAQNTVQNQSENTNITVKNISDKEIVIDFQMNQFDLKQKTIGNETFDYLSAENLTLTYQKGMPDILKKNLSIQIPNEEWLNEIEMLVQTSTIYRNVNLIPSQGMVYRNADDSKYTKNKIYQINEFYPKEIAKVSEPFIFRHTRGERLTLYPFQYNPVTKELKVYTKIKLRLKSKGDKGINPLLENKQGDNKAFSQLYSKLYANYNQNYRYTPVEEEGDLLIIAHNNFYNSMQDFVNWKRQSGISTELVNLNSIGNTPIEIKEYIHNYYHTHNLSYVLLVGDNTHIPSLYSNGDSDQAYAQVSGDDHYPEFFVGRFSVESMEQLNTIKGKSIWYEKEVSTSDVWLQKATNIASEQGSAEDGDDAETDQEHMENIRTQLLDYGYITVDEAYANNGIDSYTLSSYINEGRGLVNYVGHGTNSKWVTSGFDIEDVNDLSNYNKLPFIFDVACINGNFHNRTCFAEAWIRANSSMGYTGAVAIIASTINQSWAPPMDGQDEMIDVLLDSYPDNIKKTFGGITYNGVMHMLDEYGEEGISVADTWTIFGDPSLHVRTKTPITLEVNHPSEALVGQNSLAVNCSVENALITLSYINENNEVILLSKAKVQSGIANLDISMIQDIGSFTITATAFNYIPSITTLTIESPTDAYLNLRNISIMDNNANANNNQKLDYNEQVKLSFDIYNIGLAISEDATIKIACDNEFITLIDSVEALGNIAAQSNIHLTEALEFKLENGIMDNTEIPFSYSITDNNQTYSGYFTLKAYAPKLEVEYINLTNLNNNSSYLNNNDDFRIALKLKNKGKATISNAQLKVSSSNTHIEFNNSLIEVETIEAESEITVELEGRLNEFTEITSAEIIFKLEENTPYEAQTNILLPLNLKIETWESNNFDSYDWINDSSHPWTIAPNEGYEGSNALKSGNIGNDNSSSFSISFYLESSDSIHFMKKVSSEAASYPGYFYDYCSFSINGSEKSKWGGEEDWSQESYALSSAGTYTLQWEYIKDSYGESGSDCAWIDNIILPSKIKSSIKTLYTSETTKNNLQVYPNPTQGEFNISYVLNQNTEVEIAIYNLSGQLIKTISKKNQAKGSYTLQISSLKWEPGVYFVKKKSGSNIEVQKLIIH